MVNFLANAFAAIFSVLCVVALTVIALIAVVSGHPFAAPWIILAGFIMLALFVGWMATVIDMRWCLRRLVEIEETRRSGPPPPERTPPRLGPLPRARGQVDEGGDKSMRQ